jgi:hypothetical protein
MKIHPVRKIRHSHHIRMKYTGRRRTFLNSTWILRCLDTYVTFLSHSRKLRTHICARTVDLVTVIRLPLTWHCAVSAMSLVPLRRVLLEKLIVARLVDELFVFYASTFTKSRHWILSSTTWVQCRITHYFLMTSLTIILPSISGLPRGLFLQFIQSQFCLQLSSPRAL